MTRKSPHPAVRDNRSRLIDIVAVFDTTGSMSNKIQGLVESMARIVSGLGGLQLDWRFTCVPFGDLTIPTDRIVADLPFHRTVGSAQNQLRSLPRFSGGSNLGESSAEAMLAALDRDFRPNAVKVIVLITDEPALGQRQVLEHVDDRLGTMEALCFTIAPDLPYFRDWADHHGGSWQPIGASIDGQELALLFEDVMNGAATIADDVLSRHGGSLRRYLARATLPSRTIKPQRQLNPAQPGVVPARRISRAPTRALPPTQRTPPSRRLGPGRG